MKEAVRKISVSCRNPNNVFRLVKKMKIKNADVIEGRCMRENDGTFHLNVKDTEKFWKAHVENYDRRERMGSN